MKNTHVKDQFSVRTENSFLNKILSKLLVSLLISSVVFLMSCKKNDDNSESCKKELLRKTAINFYTSLYSADQSTLKNYVATTYVEHQISAAFTFTGLKEYAKSRTQSIENHKLIIHRTIVQGNLVGLHIEEKVKTDSSVARMALFRFNADGKVIEHWEAMQGEPKKSANPNTMFDGAVVNYSSSVAGQYLDATVKSDMQVFNNYDTLIVRQTRDGYIQHNPLAGNGPDALIGLLTFFKSKGFKTVANNYIKLAEGDFVLELNNYQTSPDFPGLTNSVAFDLIRLTQAGKEAEHWDVLEEIKGADKTKAF